MFRKFLLIIVVFLSFSCTSKNEKLTNIVILLDFSKSIPQKTQEWYRNTINTEIIANLGEKDQLTVLPIDYGSATGSTELLHADMNAKTFKYKLDSPVSGERPKNRRISTFLKDVSTIFDSTFNYALKERGKYALGTDVLGGLKQANKYIEKNQNNMIIIFSDMVNETEE